MKYQCEICGAVISDMSRCAAHEQECRLRNQTALWLVDELSTLMNAAKQQKIGLGVEITTPNADGKAKTENKTDFYTLSGAEFNVVRNRVIVNVKQTEAIQTTTEKGDKLAKKS